MSETLFLPKKKKNLFHSFKTYKKQIWFFYCQKPFLLFHHKTDLNFYYQNHFFLNTTKHIWYFDKSKSFLFFNNKNKSKFLKTKRRDSIHK